MAEQLLTPFSTYGQWETGRYRVPGTAAIAAELLCEIEGISVPEAAVRELPRLSKGDALVALLCKARGSPKPKMPPYTNHNILKNIRFLQRRRTIGVQPSPLQ